MPKLTAIAPKRLSHFVVNLGAADFADAEAVRRLTFSPAIRIRREPEGVRIDLSNGEAGSDSCAYIARSASWRDYEALSRIVGERRMSLAFHQGVLELRMPGHVHEKILHLLIALIDAICAELRIPQLDTGSLTLKRPDLECGAEPDCAFYFGEVARALNAKSDERLDMSLDPAPHLAIEVDIASDSLDRPPIYAALGIAEVWRWSRGAVEFLTLGPDSAYVRVAESRRFPRLTAQQVNRLLDLRQTLDKAFWQLEVREFIQRELASAIED